MGNLVGAKLPAIEHDAEPTDEQIKQHIVDTQAFLPLLYEVSVDPLGERGKWAEADIAVATDDNDVVLAFNVVRVSIDNEVQSGFGSIADESVEYFDWIREVAAWAHSVDGMVRWVWYHVHPEGMAQPSSNDEQKVTLINAADLLQSGHLGANRRFQSFIVCQRAGIVALQSENVNGTSPEVDAVVSRLYAESYARGLGFDHPLAMAMNEVASAIERFVEFGDTTNPMRMIMFGFTELMPLQQKLNEARSSVESEEALGVILRADFEANGPITGTMARPDSPVRPALGFAPPTPIDLPQLAPEILADLSQFNFDGLDSQ